MKCQYCERTATLHITELTDGQVKELHLCKEHAHEYLSQADAGVPQPTSSASSLAHHLTVGNTAEDLARLDQKVCPICGISFYEFRNSGRLGCPNDYTCFQQELEGLLLNIHGETSHVGKLPGRGATDLAEHTRLIQMRRQLKEAVSEEDYELASKLRDEIRDLRSEFREGRPTESEPKAKKPRKRQAPRPKPPADEGSQD
ncbi:MAG: UvrB/UvrC motif-containing protein [Pirellulales bacterium]|nr:UvrB/UvrC motif-containing protein [Pirellulales bacterium]